jgi:hypothetical protein
VGFFGEHPINDDRVMTRQDDYTKNSYMARTYLEAIATMKQWRNLKSVNQRIRNTTFKINNLNRTLAID